MQTINAKRLNEVVKAFSGLNWEIVGEIRYGEDMFQCWVKLVADQIILCCTHRAEWDAVRVTEVGLTGGLWDAIATGTLRYSAQK